MKREDCERFFVETYPSKLINLSATEVKMTPAQFRTIQAKGFVAEVDFTVTHQDDITVTFDSGLHAATINSPTESRMRVWTINGDFQAVRWMLPGTGEVVEVWKRTQ